MRPCLCMTATKRIHRTFGTRNSFFALVGHLAPPNSLRFLWTIKKTLNASFETICGQMAYRYPAICFRTVCELAKIVTVSPRASQQI